MIAVDCNRIAAGAGSGRSANVVAVGAYNALKGHIKPKTIENVLRETFASKGDDVVGVNLKAFAAGIEAVAGVKTP
jgi:Pyruvate/2-oxoacid:ferredoxin oxidoreductase gamma subunit